MGAKENIEYIKDELSNEEKLLESVIKVEKFYKKHRAKIISLLVLLILGGGGYGIYSLKIAHDLKISNEAYQKLLKNPQDKEALQTLKEKNEKLYNLYLYQQAIKNKNIKVLEKVAKSNDPILSDLAKYHIAVMKKDYKLLDQYAVNSNAILQEFAILDESYLLFRKKDIQKARKKLNKIENSPAAPYALLLGHYGTKVTQ